MSCCNGSIQEYRFTVNLMKSYTQIKILVELKHLDPTSREAP